MHIYKMLLNSLTTKHSRLYCRGEIDTLEQLANIAAWLGNGNLREADYHYKRLIVETEYDLGLRKRKYKQSDVSRRRKNDAIKYCTKHSDRKGVYIINGEYYCRSCGVCLRRKMKKQLVG